MTVLENQVVAFTFVLRPSFGLLLVQVVLFEVLFDFELVLTVFRLGHVIHS